MTETRGLKDLCLEEQLNTRTSYAKSFKTHGGMA
jgi:hypothetical protein